MLSNGFVAVICKWYAVIPPIACAATFFIDAPFGRFALQCPLDQLILDSLEDGNIVQANILGLSIGTLIPTTHDSIPGNEFRLGSRRLSESRRGGERAKQVEFPSSRVAPWAPPTASSTRLDLGSEPPPPYTHLDAFKIDPPLSNLSAQ